MMNKKKPPIQINSKQIYLRYPSKKDSEKFIGKSINSRKFHKGLVSPPQDLESFNAYLKRNESEANENLLICLKSNDEIIGVINFSQIFYGGFKNAYLGYYLFAEFSGKGLMTEALNLALKYAFNNLKLHRLEANIQPQNQASINLVKRCGFAKEGFSPKYLKIGGKWCDHERWAIIKENWESRK